MFRIYSMINFNHKAANKDDIRKLLFTNPNSISGMDKVKLYFFVEHLSALVTVHCAWDNPRLHSGSPPMYVLWQRRDTSSPLVSALTDQSTINRA